MSLTKPQYTYKDLIYIILLVVSSLSGYLIDKTEIEGRVTIVEKLAEKNAEKLEKANLELILYRMKQFEISMTEMKTKVDGLDTKMGESTNEIMEYLRNNKRR